MIDKMGEGWSKGVQDDLKEKSIQGTGSMEYIERQWLALGKTTSCLDGDFTAVELRKIAGAMDDLKAKELRLQKQITKNLLRK